MYVGRGFALMFTLSSCGLAILLFGIVFTITWPSIWNDIIAKVLQLTPQSFSYEAWKQPPINLSLDVYVFNWTNHEDFQNHSIKPHFDELGPYRFTEKPSKVNIQFNPENSTVTYRRLSVFQFDAAGSKGNLNDIVTSVNVIALTGSEKARFADVITTRAIAMGFSMYRQKVHVTKSVSELLFEGYEDNMVKLAKQLPFFENFNVPFDRVGWFYMRNNSADLFGYYNVNTGVADIQQLGMLKNWNFKDTNGAYEGDCGQIRGSAGEFFAPQQPRNGTISIFVSDMCRDLKLEYEKDVDVNGMLSYKFSGAQRSIDNGSLYEENLCFDAAEGLYSGVLNVSSCRYGVPVFVSYPHFFAADPYYREQVDGMDPVEEKHQFYMSLEPSTGVVMDVAARLQLNLLINPNAEIGIYSKVPKHFMPILWFEQRVTMPPEIAIGITIAKSISWIVQVGFVIVLIIGLTMLLWRPINYFWHNFDAERQVARKELEKPKKREDLPLLLKKEGIVGNAQFESYSKCEIY
ncbi:hypothetical protein HA402_010416 [Bradysia odoriphaga]|nr:hypothetical protein HA402_010416 [Bradysia odoriphaga]